MLYTFTPGDNLSVGYMQAALNYLLSLQTQNIDFTIRPLGRGVSWREAPFWAQDAGDYFLDCNLDGSVNLVQLTPSQLCEAPIWNGAKNIALTTFETTRLPQWIIRKLNEAYCGVIVPSQFNQIALQDSGLTIPTRVVEHALGDWWFDTENASTAPDKGDSYVFGYVGAWNRRKNPEAVLRAYLKAFPEDNDKTNLLLKVPPLKGLKSLLEHLKEDREDIWIYSEIFDEEQMLWIFNLIDCFVSAHRGEGFGLGLAQAAALGKPVIYTDFSAPTEWLSASSGHFPLPYTLEETQGAITENDLHFKGESLAWAEPSEQHLVETLLQVESSRPAPTGTLELRERLSWTKVGTTLRKAIEELSGETLKSK
tara:strand:+ start:4882 stop:5982 length:1101 start_codon:yes stop_codon:yes gene_type:complete